MHSITLFDHHIDEMIETSFVIVENQNIFPNNMNNSRMVFESTFVCKVLGIFYEMFYIIEVITKNLAWNKIEQY